MTHDSPGTWESRDSQVPGDSKALFHHWTLAQVLRWFQKKRDVFCLLGWFWGCFFFFTPRDDNHQWAQGVKHSWLAGSRFRRKNCLNPPPLAHCKSPPEHLKTSPFCPITQVEWVFAAPVCDPLPLDGKWQCSDVAFFTWLTTKLLISKSRAGSARQLIPSLNRKTTTSSIPGKTFCDCKTSSSDVVRTVLVCWYTSVENVNQHERVGLVSSVPPSHLQEGWVLSWLWLPAWPGLFFSL